MPFCTYCGQSFTRDEHLERHILTHTNVKPYKCFTCHMSFARRDLLHRHYTVHGKDGNQDPLPASNGIVPKSAGRTPIACSNCAKTKTKCDKKFPCTRCATRNLKCTVRPTRRMTKNAARLASDEKMGISDSEAQAASGSNSGDSANGSPLSDRKLLPHSAPVTPVDNASPTSIKAPDSCLGHSHSHPHPHPHPHSHSHTPSSHGVSPDGTPVSTMAHTTPLSGYSDFIPGTDSRDDCDQSSSPQFMLDWTHMPMPFGFDQSRPDMIFSPGAPFTPGGFMDPMGFMPPPTSGVLPNLMTQMQIPLPTPGLDHMDPGFPASAPAVMSMDQSYFTPRPSSNSAHSNLDSEVNNPSIDAWSAFRCTPPVPSTACPKSAKQNLERLEQGLKSHDSWSTWRPTWDDADYALGDKLIVSPLQEMPRDKLLAITQTFLHKALDTHKDEHGLTSPGGNSPMGYQSTFVILPPARVLEFFLQSYVNGFERYYPLTAKGTLNANELLRGYNDKASSLLILLMIAQGAMITPSVDARWLTAGLTEACRISLFDLIEKNIMMSGDSQVLHSALLFTVQAAWSGDKWQMDIAMGQRGMYLAMLRHSGHLGPRQRNHMSNQGLTVDTLWDEWVQDESRSRLIYSWAMVDQDLSLFYDTAPLFSVTEFGEPMPDSDGLWHAKSAHEWSGVFEQVHEFSGGYSSLGSGARPLSLRDLFRHFLDDAIISQGIELTPLHLRLLLHPLQSLVSQFRQLLSCFSDNVMSRAGSRSVTAATTRVRLEEVQAMLQRWYGLADRYMKMNPMCPMMQANLVMFHLISLNAVTNFPEIEKLARREEFDGSYQQLSWLHKRCISDVEEAIFHCGQVIRHMRAMPRSIRPPWWAAAIYRVSLILWTDSLTHNNTLTPTSGLFPSMDTAFAVDALPPDHPMVGQYLTKREGSPMLTKRDGSLMPIDNPFGVLFHCVDVINEGVSTMFSDGIRSKLERLAKGGVH